MILSGTREPARPSQSKKQAESQQPRQGQGKGHIWDSREREGQAGAACWSGHGATVAGLMAEVPPTGQGKLSIFEQL